MPIAHSCEFPTVFEIVEVLKHLGYENPLIEVRPAQSCMCLHASALVGCAVVARRGFLTLPHGAYPQPCRPQDKTHPRSDFSQRGRVRVELKDPITGDPTVEDIVNRKQLLMKLAAMIPSLKSRKEKPPLDQDGLPPGYPGLQGPMPGMPAEAATPIVSQGSSKKKGKKK